MRNSTPSRTVISAWLWAAAAFLPAAPSPARSAQEDGLDDARVVSMSVPTALRVGEQATAVVTVENVGDTTWTLADSYRLGSQEPQDTTLWRDGRVDLAPGESVGPGERKEFRFPIQAPAVAGEYKFAWRMLREGVTWFGEASEVVTVSVTQAPAPTNDARVVSMSVPTALRVGEQATAVVTVENTGQATWTRADEYRLGSQEPQDNTLWRDGRVDLAQGESVGPGQRKEFRFPIRAPAAPGEYKFAWRMVRENVAWFGERTEIATVSVTQAPAQTAPTLGWIAPAQGAVLRGVTAISGTAADDRAVSRVDILVNLAKVGEASLSAGRWTYSLDPARHVTARGEVNLSAQAFDADGLSARDTVRVTLDPAPVVTRTEPPGTLHRDLGAGVFPDLAFHAGRLYMAFQRGAEIVLMAAPLGTAEFAVERTFSIGAGAGAFPRLGSHGGALWLAYRSGDPGQTVKLWRSDTGAVEDFGASWGNDPVAIGHGYIAWALPRTGFPVARRALTGGPVETLRDGAPTGLSRIMPDGSVVLIDEDRFRVPGHTRPWYAGPLTTVEGAEAGAVLFFQGGSAAGDHELWSGQMAHTPHAATDGSGRYAVATWNPSVRVAVFSRGDGGVDRSPPTVRVTAPEGGSRVSGAVTVRGTASDDRGVVSVSVSLDGGAFRPAQGTTDWSLALGGGERLPAPAHAMRIGYYYADGRYGDHTAAVFPYTNLYVALPRGYQSDLDWRPQFRASLERAAAAGKDIFLMMDEEAIWGEVMDIAAPHWARVRKVEVGHEPTWDRATAEAKIGALRAAWASRGLPARPVGIVFTTPQLAGGAVQAEGLDWVGVEAYIDPPGSADPAANAAAMNVVITQSLARVPAGKKVAMIMMSYDRNGLWPNIATLVPLQDLTYERARTDPRVEDLLLFSYARPGGAKDHGALAERHRLMGEAVLGLAGSGGLADGPHSVTVRAADAADNRGEATVSFIVGTAQAPVPPAVEISAPASGATLSGTVRLSGTASHASGISRVEVLVDLVKVADAVFTGGAWVYDLDTRTLANGHRNLSAKAVSAAGTDARTTVGVSVANQSPVPVVEIASPTSGATLSGIARLSGTASHASGIARVEVLVDLVKVADAVLSGGAWAYDLDTRALANGHRNLSARAVSSEGTDARTTVGVEVSNGDVPGPELPTLPPPPSVAEPRPGETRLDGSVLTVAGEGPVNAVGLTMMSALRLYRNDRAGTEAELQRFADAGYRFVRILGMVSWDGKEILPSWSDYDAVLTGFLDAAKARGLKVQFTLFADAQRGMPERSERERFIDRVIGLLRPRLDAVLSLEVANEPWQNGFEGVHELTAYALRLEAAFPGTPVALGAPEGDADHQMLPFSREGRFPLAMHLDRDYHQADGVWRYVRQIWHPALYGRPWANNEPVGPGSSVLSDDDCARQTAHAVATFIGKGYAYVYHTDAGVGLRSDAPISSKACFAEMPRAVRTLPAGIARFDVQNSNTGFHRRPFDLRDPIIEGGAASGRGAMRVFSTVDPAVPGTFATIVMHVPEGLRLECRGDFDLAAVTLPDLAPVFDRTCRAGETVELPRGGAFLLTGGAWKNGGAPPQPETCVPSGDHRAIQARLRGPGSRAVLCPNAVFDLGESVRFTAANQEILTEGEPTDDSRALLRVAAPTLVQAVLAEGKTGAKLRHVRVDGARARFGWVAAGQGGHSLLGFGGPSSGQLVEHVKAYDPRGWTILHLFESGCSGAIVRRNDLGPAGSDAQDQWADGISLACRGSVVEDNTIVDATDGAIVVFGAPGSLIRRNAIRQTDRTLLGGINMVDVGPFDGDYAGTVVSENRIEAAGGFIKVGVAMGPWVWGCPAAGTPMARGGRVERNTVTGSPVAYPFAAGGVADWAAVGNVSDAALEGVPGDGCGRGAAQPAHFVRDPARSGGQFQNGFRSTNVGHLISVTRPASGVYREVARDVAGSAPPEVAPIVRVEARELAGRDAAAAPVNAALRRQGLAPTADAVDILPRGVRLARPVRIQVPARAGARPAAAAAGTPVYRYDEAFGRWELVAEAESLSDGYAVVSVSETGLYAVLAADTAGAPGAPAFGEAFAFPNPAVGVPVTFHAEVTKATRVEFLVYDMAGGLVYKGEAAGAPAVGVNGRLAYEHAWNPAGSSSGSYIGVIVAEGPAGTERRLVKVGVVR